MSSKKYNKKDKRAEKKELILNTGKKRSGLALAAVVSVALIAIGAGVVLYTGNSGNSTSAGGGTVVTAEHVTHPADLFADGRARHFQYAHGNLNIQYFVLRSSDGVIRAAFDACDVCWPAGKGYYQDGDVMVCRNCGRRFASIKINEIKGGCNPAPLNRRMENGRVVINIQDIIQGGRYFNFNKKV